jgi:sugar phosphate isomerase/epimerase
MLCIDIVLKDKKKRHVEFPWKIGIVGFMVYPNLLKAQNIEESIRELAEDPFFDLLELNFMDDGNWRKVESIVRDCNKEVSIALQPFTNTPEGNICSLDNNTRHKALNEVRKMIIASSKRNIKVVALSSGIRPEEGKKSEAMEALVRSLVEICKYADENNVHILLETFDTSYDKNLLIGPLEDAAYVVKEIRKEYRNIGILWDLSHGPFLDEKPSKLVGFKDVLSHIHLGCAKKVNNTMKDWHPSFYRNGAINAVEDLVELFSTLERISYKGAVSFEVKPEEGQQTQEVINVSKGVLYTSFCKHLIGKNYQRS